jgi:hypothetical protein
VPDSRAAIASYFTGMRPQLRSDARSARRPATCSGRRCPPGSGC